MKNLEDKIKQSGFPEEELPLGHRDRFEQLLDKNFGTKIADCEKPKNRVSLKSRISRRIIIVISSAAAVIAIVLATMLTPSEEELMNRELAAMRQELIDNNIKELERLHNSILDLAKEKLSIEDYTKIQHSINELHDNYLSIIDKSDSIPMDSFEAMMRRNMNLNITVYRRINKQLAINTNLWGVLKTP